MEKWEEIIEKTIPSGKYQALVKNGEESGLIIELESNQHEVIITFGVVVALRMLDEGIVLTGIFDEHAIQKYKNDNFSKVIYKVQNGEFGNFMQQISDELFEYLELKHFIIITMNYVIEVISKYEPNIEVIKK